MFVNKLTTTQPWLCCVSMPPQLIRYGRTRNINFREFLGIIFSHFGVMLLRVCDKPIIMDAPTCNVLRIHTFITSYTF